MIITLKDKFNIENAKSKAFESHTLGAVAFVTNGLDNNGILGYIEPLPGDRIFDTKAISVSSFCEATIQKPPFIGRGNGGSGLVILVPKEEMTYEDLYFYAAQINQHKWRFSFGRMVIGDRIKDLPLIEKKKELHLNQRLDSALQTKINYSVKLKGKPQKYTIEEFFSISYGQKEYESKDGLQPGKTVLISSKGEDKGCYGLFNIPPFYKAPIVTVPRTGTIGHAFVQEYDCCANSDCIVLIPKDPKTTLSQLYQVAAQIRKIKWKYNYGRKITPERLSKEEITLFNDTSPADFNENVSSGLAHLSSQVVTLE